ncbi:hypothetical protein BCR35DRAFT_72547 [Leucosporidium creatinivorum]|uniref:Uncharacterized protein n=1 Tax=Leucosporidium creatinivorum TaxID=106004 RepID=A0A1Y2G2Q6_9BASI|nr:hypothetical protein BCR35DRAFT_72547 [Leucosporidium creatinivorum]
MTAPRWTLGVQDRPRLNEASKDLVLASDLKGKATSEVVKGKGNGRMRLKKGAEAPSTALLDQLMARHTLEQGKALASSLDDKLLEALLKKKQGALREAERRGGLAPKDGQHSFDQNAPRGGPARVGGYLSTLELLLREEREKEKKLGGGGKDSSAKEDEKLDSKVLLRELLKANGLESFSFSA